MTPLEQYTDQLRQWATRVNLVSHKDLPVLEQRHITDCLAIVPHLPPHVTTIYDWGSGAGLPGMVIAIMCPHLTVHLIESDGKKCTFLRQTAHLLALKNVIIHQKRVEECTFTDDAPFCITSRAMTELKHLLNYMHHFSTPQHAQALFFKGRDYKNEIAAAQELFTFDCQVITVDRKTQSVLLRISDVSTQ